jgi:mRNA interferase YafQ
MLNPIQISQFKKDVKLCQKRNMDMRKLKEIMLLLINEKPLPTKCKDHPLKHNWNHHRDCHIEPDWVLIYKIDGSDIYFVRTGSHSDLF